VTIRLFVEFDRLRDVRGRFTRLTDDVSDRLRFTTQEAAERAYRALYRKAPRNQYSETPGASLANKIRIRSVRTSGYTTTAEIELPEVAAFTRPPGTRPHVIRPKGQGYPLRFYWHKIGAWRAAYEVNHPGYNPSEDWADEAMDEVRDSVETDMRSLGRIVESSFGDA
jgi:hypothetical protein